MNTLCPAMVIICINSPIRIIARSIVKVSKATFKIFGKGKRMWTVFSSKFPFITNNRSFGSINSCYCPVIFFIIEPIISGVIICTCRADTTTYDIRKAWCRTNVDGIAIGTGYIVPIKGF